jgi:LuxR family transcriptional regulator
LRLQRHVPCSPTSTCTPAPRQDGPLRVFFALHIRFALPSRQHRHLPEAWTDRYTEQAYALRDPIIAWGFSTTGSGRWSEIKFPDPYDILGQAKMYNMVFGLAVSTGPIKSRTIASAARDDREFTDGEIAEFSAVITRLHDVTEPPTSLTDAQVEALR